MTAAQAQVDDAELVERLSDLCHRIQNCWRGATGQPPPRRPKFFTPEWKDADALLDAMIFIERTRLSVTTPDTTVLVEARRRVRNLVRLGDEAVPKMGDDYRIFLTLGDLRAIDIALASTANPTGESQ